MSNTPTADQLRQAANIADQIETLQAQLEAILQDGASPSVISSHTPAKRGPGRPRRKKRVVSEEGRARMAEAQRKRWAAVKGSK